MSSVGEHVALPGFGLPIEEYPAWSRDESTERFPHFIADYLPSEGVTLRERRMLDFVSRVTDEPEWDSRVFNETAVDVWKSKECVYDEEINDFLLSEPMFNHCISRLREKAVTHQKTGLVSVMDAELTVVKSDSAIGSTLRQDLCEGVRSLEEISLQQKNWHPGSNDTVLDLLHPFLFPVEYDRSRALPSGRVHLEDCTEYIGKGEIIPKHNSQDLGIGYWNLHAWSKYQWLPTQIDFAPDGKPEIASYINNLHPQHHPNLYHVLEQFVDKSIPLWNECLSWFQNRICIKIEDHSLSEEDWLLTRKWPLRDQHENPQWDILSNRQWVAGHSTWSEWNIWFLKNRTLKQREPGAYVPFSETKKQPGARAVDLKAMFKDTGLQVIFKLADIRLTPERSAYKAESWHVDGALNEHICATAVYYYDSENITTSRVAFRQTIDYDMVYKKPRYESDWSSTAATYGLTDGGPPFQSLGRVTMPQGRLLAFPNVLQHRTESFRLVDPARPGHCKVLTMFLVDPHVRVLSTANVPPQREDWRMREDTGDLGDESPTTLDKGHRLDESVLEERQKITDEMNDVLENDSICFD